MTLTFSIITAFSHTKIEKETKNSLTQLSYYCSHTFLELHMCVYLHTKFQVFSIILKSLDIVVNGESEICLQLNNIYGSHQANKRSC